MKPARVKAAVVVAVTAVEGADVRAEGEAVTGVEVVAEDAIKITPRNQAALPFANFRAIAISNCRSVPWYRSGLAVSASRIENPRHWSPTNRSPYSVAAE